jgi:hypothetical protein
MVSVPLPVGEIEAVYREQEEKAEAKQAVELESIRNFFSAEEYHQKYLDKNPGGYYHIRGSYFSISKSHKETSEELRERIGDLDYEFNFKHSCRNGSLHDSDSFAGIIKEQIVTFMTRGGIHEALRYTKNRNRKIGFEKIFCR